MYLQIGIGCDGTAASDEPGQYRDSNVVKLVRAYSDVPLYVPGIGVGQRFKTIRYVTGWGAAARAREAQRSLVEAVEQAMAFHGPDQIRVFGVCWSRGHLSMLRALERSGVTVDALVILDAVSSLGEPLYFKTWDLRYPQRIPGNVRNCLHLVALHEDRPGFAVRLFQERTGLVTLGLEGDHAEIGRGAQAYTVSGEFLRLHGFLQRQPDTRTNGWGPPTRKLASDLQDFHSWQQNLLKS